MGKIFVVVLIFRSPCRKRAPTFEKINKNKTRKFKYRGLAVQSRRTKARSSVAQKIVFYKP
jgi:hypothetical protein